MACYAIGMNTYTKTLRKLSWTTFIGIVIMVSGSAISVSDWCDAAQVESATVCVSSM